MLEDLVKDHKLEKGERINIVAHSHGGNVALEGSKDMWIDVLVTLGTPVRDDYKGNSQNIGVWIQGWAAGDSVQIRGGHGDMWCWGMGECGPVGREFSDADDNVDTGIETGPLQSHADLHTPNTWKLVTSQMKDAAAEICSRDSSNSAACGVANDQ